MFLFSQRRRRARDAAQALYASAVEAARRPVLFEELGVPDTLDGRFEMITLHLFPIIHRLMPADADPELARVVSETFVNEMDAALREMGVGDLTVPKRMKVLYRSFAGRVSAYSKAVDENPAALRAAVARNVYPEGDPQGCAGPMAAYLRLLVDTLGRNSLDELRSGSVTFPEPATTEQVKP